MSTKKIKIDLTVNNFSEDIFDNKLDKLIVKGEFKRINVKVPGGYPNYVE